MGWIKTELPDAYHDRLRRELEDSDKPTHVLTAHWLMEYMDEHNVGADDE